MLACTPRTQSASPVKSIACPFSRLGVISLAAVCSPACFCLTYSLGFVLLITKANPVHSTQAPEGSNPWTRTPRAPTPATFLHPTSPTLSRRPASSLPSGRPSSR